MAGAVSSSGPMGTDTFLFINSQTQKPDFIQDLAFGCGLINRNINFGQNDGPQNTIAGLFGLSPGPRSFPNQLDAQIQGKFSFCLTSWAEPNLGRSTMYFGDSAQSQGPNVQQIPMHARERYHLYFSGISVNGNRLSIDPSICALTDDDASKGTGFFVDSGAPTTILPKTAYQALRAAMVDYFAQYGWQTIGGQTFDLCYTATPKEGQSFPSVVFHFSKGDQGGEVDWTMDKDNMFVRFDQIDGFCMVVGEIPDPGPCLLGAYQLANFKVSFDVKNGIFSFAPQRCQENL
ncbi:aspartic proteinase nepenthesin-2-like [Chenopodium quinoa]|nr:aspartic proteinase nepenthesin-2-like [Chenopodium quinoa]